LRQLSRATEKGLGYASEQALLESIRFDTIEDRQIAVREAHHKTFSWILHRSEDSQSHENFADWLASDGNLFWGKISKDEYSKTLLENAMTDISTVSGKPGSGKSTLMKFICEHENTRKILETWAKSKGQELVTASFFFWNAGMETLSFFPFMLSMLSQILGRQSPVPSKWMNNFNFLVFKYAAG
jgi:hypothetical protein